MPTQSEQTNPMELKFQEESQALLDVPSHDGKSFEVLLTLPDMPTQSEQTIRETL